MQKCKKIFFNTVILSDNYSTKHTDTFCLQWHLQCYLQAKGLFWQNRLQLKCDRYVIADKYLGTSLISAWSSVGDQDCQWQLWLWTTSCAKCWLVAFNCVEVFFFCRGKMFSWLASSCIPKYFLPTAEKWLFGINLPSSVLQRFLKGEV